jgi:polysaccharide biosynthesis/export protein
MSHSYAPRSAPLCATTRSLRPPVWILLITLALGNAGCRTHKYEPTDLPPRPASGLEKSEAMLLREGDMLRITFPGAPNLNATSEIRRDGKISLGLIGEVTAAGKSPADFEKELVQLYAGQLVSREVTVTVESSSFPVFVTGAVLRPGRIDSRRPLTALEAVMEAGGFDYARANLKAVQVVRNTRGHVEHFTLNMKRMLEGQDTQPFYLKPSDIIYVREKFNWF